MSGGCAASLIERFDAGLKRVPFGTGPKDLMVAYAANAELLCFLVLGWPIPCNVVDLFVETAAAVNGNSDVWARESRPGLLDALELNGLGGISAATKNSMREIILGNQEYTEQ